MSKQVRLAGGRLSLNETAVGVLVLLAETEERQGRPAVMSVASIAEAAGCTAPTARRAVGALSTAGLVDVHERVAANGGRQENAHELTALGYLAAKEAAGAAYARGGP